MASAEYELKRASKDAVAVWCVNIHFPAFEGLDEKDFYWSTADNIELEDGNIYIRHLKEAPKGRHQSDRGNDYAQISVSNPYNELYQEILPYEDLIEKCDITIREAYEIETDYYHSEIKFKGYLKEFTVSGEDQALQISAVSDMSRSGFWAGNRVLTRERCGTSFNVNGTLPATESICGWQSAQGGNPLYCSKLAEGVDGCKAHNNLHRFYAIQGLTSAVVTIVSNDSDDTGWDYTSGACFTDKIYVVLHDFTTIPISKVIPKETKTLGFDPFDNDKLVSANVLAAKRTPTSEYWESTFESDTVLEGSHLHRFYIGEQQFLPVAFLGSHPAVGMDSARKPARTSLCSIEKVVKNVFFYNLHTTSNNYIITDAKKQFFFFVHNSKPRLDGGDIQVL